MKQTTLTILCENRALTGRGIVGEHGFSALIETPHEPILMDAGQGLGLRGNAEALNINLNAIEKLVVSHGHYDHTDGLDRLAGRTKPLDIYAHPGIFGPKYAANPDKPEQVRFIGMRYHRDYLASALKARFHLTRTFTKISEGVYFSGEVPRLTDFEKGDRRLLLKQGDAYVPDPLLDDAALLIETGAGPVVLAGCAHSGIVNILHHFSRETGHTRFHAVIGGTHLGFIGSDTQLEKTMEAFDLFQINLIAVSHCTGNEAAALCFLRFGQRFAFANAGWQIRF